MLRVSAQKKQAEIGGCFQHLSESAQNTGILTATYEVAFLVAKKKAHIMPKTLIVPPPKNSVRHVMGEEGGANLNGVLLSNDTVKRRIEEMSVDVSYQVVMAVKASNFGFAIQLDEFTDVAKCSINCLCPFCK